MLFRSPTAQPPALQAELPNPLLTDLQPSRNSTGTYLKQLLWPLIKSHVFPPITLGPNLPNKLWIRSVSSCCWPEVQRGGLGGSGQERRNNPNRLTTLSLRPRLWYSWDTVLPESSSEEDWQGQRELQSLCISNGMHTLCLEVLFKLTYALKTTPFMQKL